MQAHLEVHLLFHCRMNITKSIIPLHMYYVYVRNKDMKTKKTSLFDTKQLTLDKSFLLCCALQHLFTQYRCVATNGYSSFDEFVYFFVSVVLLLFAKQKKCIACSVHIQDTTILPVERKAKHLHLVTSNNKTKMERKREINNKNNESKRKINIKL